MPFPEMQARLERLAEAQNLKSRLQAHPLPRRVLAFNWDALVHLLVWKKGNSFVAIRPGPEAERLKVLSEGAASTSASVFRHDS